VRSRRITTEVSAGTYAKATRLTVNEAIDQWLAGRRGIRKVSLEGYVDDLKPVRRVLGGKRLQQLTKADGDALVSWMLTEGRQSPCHYQPMSLAGRVSAMVAQHPAGTTAAELAATFAVRH
jgi:site-specific recombinase XerD